MFCFSYLNNFLNTRCFPVLSISNTVLFLLLLKEKNLNTSSTTHFIHTVLYSAEKLLWHRDFAHDFCLCESGNPVGQLCAQINTINNTINSMINSLFGFKAGKAQNSTHVAPALVSMPWHVFYGCAGWSLYRGNYCDCPSDEAKYSISIKTLVYFWTQ